MLVFKFHTAYIALNVALRMLSPYSLFSFFLLLQCLELLNISSRENATKGVVVDRCFYAKHIISLRGVSDIIPHADADNTSL